MPFTIGPLVDALSSGAAPPHDDDDIARLLAGWRDDLTTGLDTTTPTQARPATHNRPAPVVALRPTHRPHAAGRRRAAIAAAIAVALAATTGVGAASWRSTPTSPLWPVTRVLYPHHAQAITIEHTISQARHALRDDNLTQAAQLINTARHQLANADDLNDDVAEKLRAQIDALIVDLASRRTTPTARPPAPPTPTSTGPPTPAAPPATASTPKPSPPATTTPTPNRLTELLPELLPLPGLTPSPNPSSTSTPSPTQPPGPLLPPPLDDVLSDIPIQLDFDITVDDPTGLLGNLAMH